MSVLFPVAGAIGCGSDTSAAQACQDVAHAECQKRMTYSDSTNPTGASIVRTFGSMENCVMQETLACMNRLAAPATGNNPAVVEKCVAAFATYSCADFFNNNPPAVCAPTGPGVNGSPCEFNAQCSSGYCSGTKNVLCGVCAAIPAADTSCATTNCAHDQTCVSATTECEPVGVPAGSCDDYHPCGDGLSCLGNDTATSTAGSCMAAGEQVGTPCGEVLSPAVMAPRGCFAVGPRVRRRA
jgi:hypothetical protein